MVATLLLAVALSAGALRAQEGERLGTVDFPNSGASAAQDAFIRGVLLLHSFEYEDARAAFREARRIDRDFALAYWGEAMTFNHPVWMRQYRDQAQAALNRLAPTPSERIAKAPTQREKDYLRAVEILFGDGEKRGRDFKYRDAMRRLAERYPDDHNAVAFYALSWLGTAHEGRDFTTYMRAAAIGEPVFRANPDHPGAAHYLIHSYDDPIHAPLGLPAARAYSVIAPGAAHAQHMTSHIFIAMGMWDEVVKANETAVRVQNTRLEQLGRPANVCGHYTSWLEYGYLQQGRYREAASMMDQCHARIQEDRATSGERGYFAQMRARYVLDTGDWDAADRWPADLGNRFVASVNYAFTTAYGAIKRGDIARARGIIEEVVDAIGNRNAPRTKILASELHAMLAVTNGKPDEAIAMLREAATQEEGLPYEFGPPTTVKPPHELLGQVLHTLGRYREARDAFQASLARMPRRTASLLGLARTAAALGDDTSATEAYRELAAIWRSADSDFRALEEARRFADTDGGNGR